MYLLAKEAPDGCIDDVSIVHLNTWLANASVVAPKIEKHFVWQNRFEFDITLQITILQLRMFLVYWNCYFIMTYIVHMEYFLESVLYFCERNSF